MAYLLTILVLLVVSCSSEPPESGIADPPDPVELGQLFVSSQQYRRSILERSVVNPDNLYSALRLANYARPNGGWDLLPEWSPETRPLSVAHDLAPVSDWSVEWTHDGLMAAGERGFLNYPMRADRTLAPLKDVTEETAGFWVDGEQRVAGLTEVGDQLSWTCATCHARPSADGALMLGVPNAQIDIPALWHLSGISDSVVDTWERGTVDPSNDRANNPSEIGDLRAVRYQSHLHWTGTLRNSLGALAIRVETLYIVSSGETTRPPRELAFAIAYYLWNLAEAPPEQRSETFETNCGTCHHADGTVGAPLPWLKPYPGRGTGFHRVPSLVGVGDRGRLLHDASMKSVRELIASGPTWHAYGKGLPAEEQIELASWVEHHFAQSN